jgi:MFS family permease
MGHGRAGDPHPAAPRSGPGAGGEYGGAATYVAEHAPNGKRGFYTSFIQTTATLGLFMAILIILGIRT